MVEQGDIITVEEIEVPCVVVSKNTYNKSNHVIVCPITKQERTTLGYTISCDTASGVVQCDNLRMLDLRARYYSCKGRIPMIALLEIMNRVSALFDLV